MTKKDINYNDLSVLMNRQTTIKGFNIHDLGEFITKGFVNPILIEDCVFNQTLSFKECRFFKSIEFKNCEFSKGLQLNNVEILGNFELDSCVFKEEVIFKDCTFNSFISKGTHYYDVLFCGYLKNNGIKNGSISFDSSFFKKLALNDLICDKNFQIKDIYTESFQIYRSIFNSEISFGYFESEKYFFSKDVFVESTKFNQRIDFHKGKIERVLYFHKVEFDEQVVIRKDFSMQGIDFTQVKAKYTVSIDFQDNFERLEFCDCWFDTSFSANCFEKLISYEKRVSINFRGIIHGNYFIEEVPTLSVDMSCVNFGNILFHNIHTKFIVLQQFFNFNKLFFNSIRYNQDYNILIIFDSNIGNTEFENIDFRKFNEVVVAKSDISGLQLSNSIFPKKIQIKTKAPKLGYEIPLDEKINDNLYFRDSYRQLKVAMEKMGNKYYSLVYRSKEMHYQRKELNWGWDKVLLYVNYWTNNNGISWIRGIGFTLFVAFIAFISLNTQLNDPLFIWKLNGSKTDTLNAFNVSSKSFITYLSSYPSLKINNLKENWIVDLIILLSRIFVSIGIYQTISAFRKYGRNSSI